MSTTLPMSKGVSERIALINSQFPGFEVTDAMLPILEDAEYVTTQSIDDEDRWTEIKDPQILIDLKPITDPGYDVFENKKDWAEVVKDIKGGVTFGFYWKGGFLNWER